MIKYLKFVNVFLKELILGLLKYLNINKYTISLTMGKKLLYNLIYSFKSIELKIVNTYIKINLANSFF